MYRSVFLLRRLQKRRQWSTLYTEIPKAEALAAHYDPKSQSVRILPWTPKGRSPACCMRDKDAPSGTKGRVLRCGDLELKALACS